MAKKPPYMPWFPREWRADLEVRAMDRMARYGYFEILNSLWMAGGVLPDDDKALMAAADLTPKLWKSHGKAIREMLIECSPGMTAGIPQAFRGILAGTPGLTQKRLLAEYTKATNLLDRKAQGGKTRQESIQESIQESTKESTKESSRTPPAIQDKNEVIPPTPSSREWVDRFEEWWNLWPKKTAKAAAKKAYHKLIVKGSVAPEQRADLKPYPDLESRHAQLVEGTRGWSLDFARRDIDKVPYPATFLNRLDWLSAPATANSATGSPSHAEAIARLRRTKRSIDGDGQMAWESTPQYHERLRSLGWPVPS